MSHVARCSLCHVTTRCFHVGHLFLCVCCVIGYAPPAA